MASNINKIENGVILLVKDIFYKSLEPKYSKTYRLNQASAHQLEIICYLSKKFKAFGEEFCGSGR